MTTYLDHIIHTPLNAQVAIVVNCRGITSKVHIRDGIPIGLVTSRLAKNGTHQARPGMAPDQESSFTSSNGGAILVHHVGLNRGRRATPARRTHSLLRYVCGTAACIARSDVKHRLRRRRVAVGGATLNGHAS